MATTQHRARPTRLIAIAALCLLAAGCRIESRVQQAPIAGAATVAAGDNGRKAFDPRAQVDEIWDSKVTPTLAGRAAEFIGLRNAMRANLDAAGAAHGHRERGEGAPWNFATRLKGRIVSVDVESSAAKVGVDADGDGQADALVQIGPVLRGTALRDALPFISFTAYTNQIEFAQLANALNDRAGAQALKPLPRDQLMGRGVEILGAFTTDDASEMPTITAVQLKLGSAP